MMNWLEVAQELVLWSESFYGIDLIDGQNTVTTAGVRANPKNG